MNNRFRKLVKKAEPYLITLDNIKNKLVNAFVNNFAANWIKEYFETGMDYPLYLYSDEGTVYISNIHDGVESGLAYTDVEVTDSELYALNLRRFSKRKRNRIRKKANEAMMLYNKPSDFRFKNVLSLNSKDLEKLE